MGILEDIPENVRKRISEFVDGSGVLMSNPDDDKKLKSLLTQVCYEMYKIGYKDAFRTVEKSIEINKNLFK